jgi:hypothetical protein
MIDHCDGSGSAGNIGKYDAFHLVIKFNLLAEFIVGDEITKLILFASIKSSEDRTSSNCIDLERLICILIDLVIRGFRYSAFGAWNFHSFN